MPAERLTGFGERGLDASGIDRHTVGGETAAADPPGLGVTELEGIVVRVLLVVDQYASQAAIAVFSGTDHSPNGWPTPTTRRRAAPARPKLLRYAILRNFDCQMADLPFGTWSPTAPAGRYSEKRSRGMARRSRHHPGENCSAPLSGSSVAD